MTRSGAQALAAAGLVVMAVAAYLLFRGTTSMGLFLGFAVLEIVGIGMLALGRKVDGDLQRKAAEEQRNRRIQERRPQP